MSAQGEKYRNRPEEDPSTRRTAEDAMMQSGQPDRPDRPDQADRHDPGVGKTGGGSTGGSGTAGGGMENEGTGSLLVEDAGSEHRERDESSDDAGSGSTKGGRAPGVSGKRGMTGGMEKEGEGHSGPIRSGANRGNDPDAERDRAAAGNQEDNAREGYEDHGSSRDSDGTHGESSGSRPGYR